MKAKPHSNTFLEASRLQEHVYVGESDDFGDFGVDEQDDIFESNEMLEDYPDFTVKVIDLLLNLSGIEPT